MAGHEWEDWFEREEFIGQISDIRVQNLQVERELVQKRTFTRWINLHLEKCTPPMEVHDLFRDIQDGRVLMALLEELSGCKLLHGFKQSSHRIFRLNNIAKVLSFLEERNVKLVSIDAADVADGNSSIVLGLIWNIILFFQIKELTGNIKTQFPSSSSLSSIPTSSDSDTSHSSTPSEERRCSVAIRDHGKAIKTLLQWVQRRTKKFGVSVSDFGKSWTSGLAFLAVIKSIDPSLVDMRRAVLRTARENLEDAFRTAHYSLGIPRLLEPEDVTINPPDEQVIMTYVSQFLEHFPAMDEDDVSDVIERSTSKVSAHLNDTSAHNGVKRTRETYVVKRDWVKPPPKIFVSSVSDESNENQVVPAPCAKALAREDSCSSQAEYSASPSPAGEDRSPSRSLDLTQDVPLSSVSATTSCSNSPQPSFIDSVISSPDSWSELQSEIGILEKLPESPSDGGTSLICDTEQQISDRKVKEELSFEAERPFNNSMDTELFIDEGNFSISSFDSLQTKTPFPREDHFSPPAACAQDQASEAGSVRSDQEAPNEISKPSSPETSDAGCESGYFAEEKDSPPSLDETDSAFVSCGKQTAYNESESEEKSGYSESEVSEFTDHLWSCSSEQAPSCEITGEPDQMAGYVTDGNVPAVEMADSISGDCLQRESDIHSEDMLMTDALEAQPGDIHYAENVDVESVEDSDSYDGEVLGLPTHSLASEPHQGYLEQEKIHAKQPENLEEEKEGEFSSDPLHLQGPRVYQVSESSEKNTVHEVEKQELEEISESKIENFSFGGEEETCDVVPDTAGQMIKPNNCQIVTELVGGNTMEVEAGGLEENSGMSRDEEPSSDEETSQASVKEMKEVPSEGWEAVTPPEQEERDSGCIPEIEEQLGPQSRPKDLLPTAEDWTIPNPWKDNSDELICQTRDDRKTTEDKESKTASQLCEELECEEMEKPTGAKPERRHEPADRGTQEGEDTVYVLPTTATEFKPVEEEVREEEKEEEDEEEEEDSEGMPVPVIPIDLVYYPHYDVPMAEVLEALKEPESDCHADGEHRDRAGDLIGCSETEDHGRREMRLSLSVRPLQPAPVQERLPGPYTDSSDSEDDQNADRYTQKQSDQEDDSSDYLASPERPLGPPEWNYAELAEGPTMASIGSIKSDPERTIAKENTAVREAFIDDQPLITTAYLRTSSQINEVQNGNKTINEMTTPEKMNLYCRRPSRVDTSKALVDLTLEEIVLLLVLWLIVYCLFVLPQIDLRTLPQLLLNIEE